MESLVARALSGMPSPPSRWRRKSRPGDFQSGEDRDKTHISIAHLRPGKMCLSSRAAWLREVAFCMLKGELAWGRGGKGHPSQQGRNAQHRDGLAAALRGEGRKGKECLTGGEAGEQTQHPRGQRAARATEEGGPAWKLPWVWAVSCCGNSGGTSRTCPSRFQGHRRRLRQTQTDLESHSAGRAPSGHLESRGKKCSEQVFLA